MDASDPADLDFARTLDLLAELVTEPVRVAAGGGPPGLPLAQSQVVVEGHLGPVRMVESPHGAAQTVAAYPIGDKGVLYLSPQEFGRTLALSDGSYRIECARLTVEVGVIE